MSLSAPNSQTLPEPLRALTKRLWAQRKSRFTDEPTHERTEALLQLAGFMRDAWLAADPNMTGKWADEEVDFYTPMPVLESFYTLIALELGSPHEKGWLMNKSPQFHDMFKKYFGKKEPCSSQAAIIRYLIWHPEHT